MLADGSLRGKKVFWDVDDTGWMFHAEWFHWYRNEVLKIPISYKEAERIVRETWLSIKMEENFDDMTAGQASELVDRYYQQLDFADVVPTPGFITAVYALRQAGCDQQFATGNQHIAAKTILGWANSFVPGAFSAVHNTGLFGGKIGTLQENGADAMVDDQAAQAIAIAGGIPPIQGRPVVLLGGYRWGRLPHCHALVHSVSSLHEVPAVLQALLA